VVCILHVIRIAWQQMHVACQERDYRVISRFRLRIRNKQFPS
jgi:hypothetical protein